MRLICQLKVHNSQIKRKGFPSIFVILRNLIMFKNLISFNTYFLFMSTCKLCIQPRNSSVLSDGGYSLNSKTAEVLSGKSYRASGILLHRYIYVFVQSNFRTKKTKIKKQKTKTGSGSGFGVRGRLRRARFWIWSSHRQARDLTF